MQPSSRRQQIDTRAGYDLWSDSYDDTPNPVVAMDERHTFALLDPRPGEQVLDLGCGTGRYLTKLSVAGTAHSVGVDFSLGMLRAARRRVSVGHLVCADLQRDLPFAGRTFDATLCALVGEHLERLHTTLRESFRALRPAAASSTASAPCATAQRTTSTGSPMPASPISSPGTSLATPTSPSRCPKRVG